MKRRPFYESWCAVREASLADLAWAPPEERAGFADTQLRRLLFYQFLQGGVPDFLRGQFARARRQGTDRFYSEALLPLALVAPAFPPGERGAAEAALAGVPSFNMALFTPHPAEAARGIHAETIRSGQTLPATVPDALFTRWLEFLSAWHYSLDERSNDAVTPAVLGVLCEQGAARKLEGVYYTGADITGYLCGRSIIPRLLRAVYAPDHPVFILPAVSEAYLPPAARSPEPLPLETETELEARQARLRELLRTPVQSLDDWITLNLDLAHRAVQIIRAERDPRRTHALYLALTRLRVLDPTCGSGAFLLAAMETLEPLYAACQDAMRAHLGSGDLSPDLRPAFEEAVRSCARREILGRNLFGVDLMPAAVETTALRLALRVLAAAPPDHPVALPTDLYARLQTGDILAENGSVEQRAGTARFDVVVGNPPYVNNDPDAAPQLQGRWRTAACPSRYAQVLERSLELLRPDGWLGMIVPVSAVAGEEYGPLLELLRPRGLWIGTFSNRPAKLFSGVEQRLATIIAGPVSERSRVRMTRYHHWYEAERPSLFQRLQYVEASCWDRTGMPVKSGSTVAESIWRKLSAQRGRLRDWPGEGTGDVWYHDGPTYWVRALPFPPAQDGGDSAGSHYRRITVPTEVHAQALAAILSSSLFYFFFKLISNCRDLGHKEWSEFPIDPLPESRLAELARLGARLAERLRETAAVRQRCYPSGTVAYREYYPARAVEIIDEIDAALAAHYGLTPPELEHVRQSDRKYRMGRHSGSNGEDTVRE